MNQITVKTLATLALLMIGLPAWAANEVPAAVAMLPPSDALPSWLLAEEPSLFPAEDLWEHINGAAEQYLSFGCTSLAVGYYIREGSESEIAVEIYRMRDELGSFGIYTLERPVEGPYLALGAQGYQAGGDLNFFGGCYYIKLRAYSHEEAEREAVHKLAAVIAEKHLAGSAFPKELGLFPRKNLVENSYGLVPEAVLGLKGLSNALVARYRSQGREMVLNLVREEDAATAEESFSAVRGSLGKRSMSPLRQVTVDTAEGVRGELKYYGPVLLLRRGRDVILAAGAPDVDWVHSTVSRLLANLAD